MAGKALRGLIILLMCVAAFAAGCGGGERGIAPLPAAQINVKGFARAPRNSSIARTAARSAQAVQGLLPVVPGTPAAIYKINNTGALTGSPLASGAVDATGHFNLTLPAAIIQITSDMVVAVGTGANQMRAFIINTSNLAVDPDSELVVAAITGKCSSPLTEYTIPELIEISAQYRATVNTANKDYSSYSSVTSAVTDVLSNNDVKTTIHSAVNIAGGSCSALGPNSPEEDAFGNIMKTTFTTINSVDFTAPAANATATVIANITFTDESGTSSISAVNLIYYLNGNFANGNVVELMTSRRRRGATSGNYSGEIPGQPGGTKVDFIIRVEDSNGNVTSNAVSSATNLVQAIPDIDNSPDIVPDNADLLGFSANYDSQYLYVSYNVQGVIDGGTMDPPYIMLYGIKITNPDQDQGEGLMVGKLWVNMPLIKDKAFQDKFIPLLQEQGADYIKQIGQDDMNRILQTGMFAINIQKLESGNISEGFLSAAEPEGTAVGGTFTGKIKIAALGDNPSGYLRLIILTAANASLDSFMPIPLNCTHFLTIYRNSYGYTVH